MAETGTRSLLGASFGLRTGQTGYAAQLVHLLRPDMLVLTDRGFDTGGFLRAVAATGAQFLARLTSCRALPALTCLSDGTYLSRIGTLAVRVIDTQVTVTLVGGTRFTARYRLATTLTDHHRYPAAALLRLRHERREHEVAYLALRHILLDGRVLRSGDPAGLHQEIWALLAVCQAIRREMTLAAETIPGTDPDRASFTIALHAVISTLASPDVLPGSQPAGRIGQAVLAPSAIIVSPTALDLKCGVLPDEAVHWLKANFFKTEPELGRACACPLKASCVCDLYLTNGSTATPNGFAWALRAVLALAQAASAIGWRGDMRHQPLVGHLPDELSGRIHRLAAQPRRASPDRAAYSARALILSSIRRSVVKELGSDSAIQGALAGT